MKQKFKAATNTPLIIHNNVLGKTGAYGDYFHFFWS